MVAVPSSRVLSMLSLVVVSAIAACGGHDTIVINGPQAPTSSRPAPRPPTAGDPFVPPAGPVTAYVGQAGVYDSWYEFYADSTFALRYTNTVFGPWSYPGRYSRTDSTIALAFYPTGGTWGAIARISGDTIRVKYNDWMSMSDFLDGAYVRMR